LPYLSEKTNSKCFIIKRYVYYYNVQRNENAVFAVISQLYVWTDAPHECLDGVSFV